MSNRPTILIVEDDPVFRRVLHFTVTKAGFRSVTASNGEEAFQRLMQGDIDLLVTDLQMPVCSGLELLQRLQAHENFERPHTILCTAKGLELDTEALNKNFRLTAILHKPFSPRKLSDLIARTIAESVTADEKTEERSVSPSGPLTPLAAAKISLEARIHG
jgi:CheY-like chemotaxis protein